MSDELPESQLRKLKLEIALLERQNSRFGFLPQLTAMFTVIVTLGTVFATFVGWGWDRFSERQIRDRELNERNENQYRSNLQQLLRYPIDENQTLPSVVFVFNDLSNLLKNYSQKELADRKLMIGSLMAELRTSSEFDIGKSRNAEFDYAILKFCEYCSEAAVNTPKYSKIMLEKYAAALAPFHKDDDKFKYVSKLPTGEFTVFRSLESLEKEGFTIKLRPFATMVRAYELHLGILSKAAQANPKDSDALKSAIDKYACDFYLSTQNRALTKNVFNISDEDIDVKMKKWVQ